ncbi:MAG: hypothetical protein WC732_08605 [Candidatus Omnitrophota bacterium]
MASVNIHRAPATLHREWLAQCIAVLRESVEASGLQTADRLATSSGGLPRTLRSAVDRVIEPDDAQMVARVSIGRMQYDAIQWALSWFDHNGFARSYVQKQLHAVYVNSCLDLLYRDSWEESQAAALSVARISSFQKKVAVRMGRRIGKTYSISMFVAALMYGCQHTGIKITVYSSCSRASVNLSNTVRQFLKLLPGVMDRPEADNTENISLRPGPSGATRSLASLPGAVSQQQQHHTCTPGDGKKVEECASWIAGGWVRGK